MWVTCQRNSVIIYPMWEDIQFQYNYVLHVLKIN